MPSQIILTDTGADRNVQLQFDADGYLWVDHARVDGIVRDGGEVGLRMGGRRGSVWVDANAYLDFVGLRPIRIE